MRSLAYHILDRDFVDRACTVHVLSLLHSGVLILLNAVFDVVINFGRAFEAI